jgi:hypothetical protein
MKEDVAELHERIASLTAARKAQFDAREASRRALHNVEQARRDVLAAEKAVTEQVDRITAARLG